MYTLTFTKQHTLSNNHLGKFHVHNAEMIGLYVSILCNELAQVCLGLKLLVSLRFDIQISLSFLLSSLFYSL